MSFNINSISSGNASSQKFKQKTFISQICIIFEHRQTDQQSNSYVVNFTEFEKTLTLTHKAMLINLKFYILNFWHQYFCFPFQVSTGNPFWRIFRRLLQSQTEVRTCPSSLGKFNIAIKLASIKLGQRIRKHTNSTWYSLFSISSQSLISLTFEVRKDFFFIFVTRNLKLWHFLILGSAVVGYIIYRRYLQFVFNFGVNLLQV